jgi:hypothetical protein
VRLVRTFFQNPYGFWPESSEQHLQTSSTGVPSVTLGTASSAPCHKSFRYATDLRGASLRDDKGETGFLRLRRSSAAFGFI